MAGKHKEVWKHINGLSLGCEVSSFGNVRVNYGDHIKDVPLHTTYKGDIIVYLEGNQLKVHRLVAEAFLPEFDGPAIVKHIDGDLTNNSVTNLRWSSYSEEARSHVHTGKLRGTRVYCVETDRTYSTISTASAILGIPVCAVEYGLKNSVQMFGYHFKTAEDDSVDTGDTIFISTKQIIQLGIESDSIDTLRSM